MSDTENTVENEDLEQDADNEEESTPEQTASDSVADLKKRLEEAEAKVKDSEDKVLRAHAEMENIRRRSERELENAHKYGMEKFATELLPVVDSLELALIAASEEDADIEKLREGTELTVKMLVAAFEKFDINPVHPIDETFDPDFHQAMTMIEHAEKEPNTVIDVMQKGYKIKERLIRPAMVVVSKAPAEADNKEDSEQSS